jgi:hypothetical protein
MNRFLIRRISSITNTNIKSIYPKCVDCINFEGRTQTCKKRIIAENLINYDIKNELALNVRNDEKQCGEAGNWFQIGELQLQEESKGLQTTFLTLSAITGVTCFFTDASRLTLFPLAMNIYCLYCYLDHTVVSQDKIDNEKRRIERYKQFYN